MLVYQRVTSFLNFEFWWYLPCFFHPVDVFEFGPAPVTSLYGPISSLYPCTFTATTRVSLWFHLLLRLGWRLTLHSTCCGNAFARVCSCTAVNQQSYLEEKKSWWLFMRFGQPFQDIHGYTKMVVRWSPFLLQLWELHLRFWFLGWMDCILFLDHSWRSDPSLNLKIASLWTGELFWDPTIYHQAFELIDLENQLGSSESYPTTDVFRGDYKNQHVDFIALRWSRKWRCVNL